MREMHLYADRKAQPKRIVQGLNSASPILSLRETQGDSLTIFVHQYDRNPENPPLVTYVEKPLIASAVRASVGYIDAAPQSGTFKLKVGANTTAALTWPADLSTSALIAAWKASVLAAVNALASVITLGSARLDDPAGTPAHIFYFTWLNEAATTPIEVVTNRLIPWIEATVTGSVIPVGYSQQVKLARFPLRMSGAFAQATTPPVAIIESRPGSSGTNAEQTVNIPAAAAGSFALQWSGAKTKTMDVTTVTAASLAAALNAIVADGATNPSFRVEARVQREGKRFAVEFIGPLAGAAQAALVAVMYDQQGAPFWTGSLILDGLGLEMALNGAEEVTIKFELVITTDGEETYLLPFVVENDMTAASTAASAEEAGAVFERATTIYVNSGLGTSFVEASPGARYTPAAAGNAVIVTHGLGTWEPDTTVTLLEVDHTAYATALAAHPSDLAAVFATAGVIIGSHQLDDSEFGLRSTSANVTVVSLPWTMVTDASSDLDYRLLRIKVRSPDSQLVVFPHMHVWSAIRESLPSGQTLDVKLAALEAALGILGGSLRINASQIDGLLKAAQIDISSLATSFLTNADILKTFRELVKDSTLIDNIAERLGTSAKFLAALLTVCTSADFLTGFVPALLASTTFDAAISAKVLTALQAGSSLPDGTIAFAVPDFSIEVAPSYVLATIASQPVIGYPEIDIARTGLSSGADLSGEISIVPVATVHVVTDVAWSQDFGGRRGQRFLSTDTDPLGNPLKVVNPFGCAYQVTNFGSGTDWWPAAMELVILDFAVSEEIFYAGSQLVIPTALNVTLFGGWQGRLDLILEIGYDTAEATTQLASVSWTALRTWTLRLSEITAFRKLAIVTVRGADVAATWTRSTSTATATKTAHGLTTGTVIAILVTSSVTVPLGSVTITSTGANTFTFTCLNSAATSGTLTYGVLTSTIKTGIAAEQITPPTGPNFRYRLRTSRFDLKNPPATIAPMGTLKIVRNGTHPSIAPL